MTVADIYNKVNELDKLRSNSSSALALAITCGSPQSVVDSLAKDYKVFSNEYFKFMESKVKLS
ncbi:hypothetical protein D3C84_1221590 [compost metagenome]